MTEGANVETTVANAGAAQPNPGVETTGGAVDAGNSAGAEGKWYDALPDELKGSSLITRFGSVEELGKAYVNANKLISGDKVPLPRDDDPEYEAQFYEKLGKPKSADEYQLPTDSNLPFDEGLVSNFKEAAHKLNLTNKQVEGIARWQADLHATAMKDAVATLRQQHGSNFDAVVDAAETAATRLGGGEFAAHVAKNYAADPVLINFLADMNKRIGEDSVGTSTSRNSGTSKEEALRRIQEINKAGYDHPYRNKRDINAHKAALSEMDQLIKIAYGLE